MLRSFKFLCLAVIAFLSISAHAGEVKGKVVWGPEYFAPKRHYPLAFLGNLQTGFVQVSHQRGKTLTIQLFSPSLALKSEKELDLKVLPKDHDLQDCLEWGGKYYILYSTWVKSEEKERLYIQELDVQKGAMKGAATLLITCDQIRGDAAFYGFYKFHTSNKFRVQFDNDSTSMGVFVEYRPQNKQDAEKNAEYGFWVFDKALKTVWSQTRTSMPYLPKKMDIEDYTRDKDGNFLFLATVYNNDSRKKVVDNSPDFHFEIIKFTQGSKKPSIVPLNFTDKYVSQISLFEDLQGRVVCAGYYAVRDKKGKLVANGSNVDGAFLMRLNDTGDKFENIHKGVYELPTDILKQFESERTQKKMEKKEAKGEEATEQNLRLKRIIFDSDGSVIIIGEQSYSVTISYYNGKTWVNRTTYYRNDIFAQLINSAGELVWTKKIPKAQQSASTAGLGMRVSKYNGSYYFLFMDNEKNVKLTDKTAPAPFGGGYGGVLSSVRLSADGQMDKSILFDCKKLDQLVLLEQGDWLASNTFILSSVMGTNGPNDRNKLCLIKFE